MNLPLFIAQRTSLSTSSTQKTMVRIATLAVAVSITVMVITIAVVAGFRKQIHSTIRDTSADITITDLAAIYGTENRPIVKNASLDNILSQTPGIESIDSYAMCGVVIRSESDAAGIVIKGVTNIPEQSAIAKSLSEGTLPRLEAARRKELLLPTEIAEKLKVRAGDRVELLLLKSDSTPGRELFKVAGIYHPFGELPIAIALTDIRNVQKINKWDSSIISGLEVRVTDYADMQTVTDIINDSLFQNYDGVENISAISADNLYAHIFAWLDTHDINATVIVVIMFIVALFNMITALLILIFERTRMVGILKSMGMSNRAVRKIFLYLTAKIVGIGLTVGNIIALALIVIQKYTGVIKLDSSAYFVSEVPVSIGVIDIITINAIFAAIILLLLFGSTAIVSKIKPSEAVKYE